MPKKLKSKRPKGLVYLIHFSKRFKHAGHYIGYTKEDTPDARMEEHRKGNGSRLLAVINKEGIEWVLARLWNGEGRKFERKLKNRGGASRICPICKEAKETERNMQPVCERSKYVQ